MERLTAEEQVVLWPDKAWPQEIGALATLDGSNLVDLGRERRVPVGRVGGELPRR